jgi:uncharacterized protein (TIGR03083 family)
MVRFMAPRPENYAVRTQAFRAEAAALSRVAAGLTTAELGLPSPCPPWTTAGLLCHVVVAVSRVGQAIDAASGERAGDECPGSGELVTAAGYYRPDERFSADVNTDRIDVAADLATRLASVAAIRAELAAASQRSLALLAATPADQVVRTRHGDRMRLSEFAVTRVVELAVHGLDLAAGLGRPPWLTGEAAIVLKDLLLPAGGTGQPSCPGQAESLCALLECDDVGLISRLTGRQQLSAAEARILAGHGAVQLALG